MCTFCPADSLQHSGLLVPADVLKTCAIHASLRVAAQAVSTFTSMLACAYACLLPLAERTASDPASLPHACDCFSSESNFVTRLVTPAVDLRCQVCERSCTTAPCVLGSLCQLVSAIAGLCSDHTHKVPHKYINPKTQCVQAGVGSQEHTAYSFWAAAPAAMQANDDHDATGCCYRIGTGRKITCAILHCRLQL